MARRMLRPSGGWRDVLRVAHEVRLHSDEQVSKIVTGALAEALREDVPDELREIVFSTAAGLLAQKQCEFEQIGVGIANGLGRVMGG